MIENMKILVIDDEPLARLAVLRLLRQMGYQELREAESGCEGLSVITAWRPELVVCDVSMPDLDGIQLLRQVRDKKWNILFLFLSGYDLFQYAQKAIEYGAFAYLLKPVDKQEFSRMITAAEQECRRRAQEQKNQEEVNAQLWHIRNERRRTFLADVVFARVTEPERITAGCAEWELDFPHPDHCVTLIHLEAETADRVVDDSALLLYGIENIAIELLADQNVVAYGFVAQNDLCLVCNFNAETLPSAGLERVMEQVRCRCRELLYSNLYVGIGEPCTLADSYASYRKAHEDALWQVRLAYVCGGKDVPSHVGELLSDMQVQELAGAIRDGSRESLARCCRMILCPYNLSPEHGWDLLRDLALYLTVLFQYFSFICGRGCIEPLWSEHDLMKEIAQQSTANDILHWLIKKGSACIDTQKTGTSADDKDDLSDFSQAAVAYIHTNFSQTLPLESIAAHFHYTPAYFSRIFRQEIGVSFLRYLTAHRIWEAKRLLLGTDWKVRTIAQKVGFQDAKYFITVFSRYTGQQPSTYRSQYHF